MSKGYDKFDDAASAYAAAAVVEVVAEPAAKGPSRKLSRGGGGGGRKSEVNGNQFDNPLNATAASPEAVSGLGPLGNGFGDDPFVSQPPPPPSKPANNSPSSRNGTMRSNGSSISGPEVDAIEPATFAAEAAAADDERGFVNPLAAAAHHNGQSAIMNGFSHEATFDDAFGFDPADDLSAAGAGGTSKRYRTTTEVSLVDDAGAGEASQVLGNAKDFFMENNENYEMSWDEAAYNISEVADDPSKPPVPGRNLPYARWYLRRVLESILFRVITMLLILVDICFVIADLASSSDQSARAPPSAYSVLDMILTCYFVVEIGLRIFALSYPVFFSAWYNVVDFAVVLITFIVACMAVSGSDWAQRLALFSFLRFVRLIRLFRIYTEKKQLVTAARQMVSQNKRRFQQDGYDLDLTYVTARVIATSFPSTGLWSLYRNPIEKVAAFLDAKHPGKYKLYNLCSEKTYPTSHFHDRVERFTIDDHNVPSLEDMRRFAASVKAWLSADPENVIVVHCKGGKGRTGTMICVWLVEAGVFTDARESLDYFGCRRTDTNVGDKFQGVETPSQSRYVGYYEAMRTRHGGRAPAPPARVALKRITVRGMMYVGQGNGDDFWLTVSQGRSNPVFSAHLGLRRNCAVAYDPERDVLVIGGLADCPALEGDVRILFQTSSRTVPKGYEKCPFYFWFNTSFLEGGEGASPSLSLAREDLDNPHKQKTWHCFRQGFRVDVEFERLT